MRHWFTRFRRATLLLSVHLLQVFLLAASAVCDLAPATTPTGSSVAAVVSHAAHPTHADSDSSTAPAAPHHESHTTACPMAMACASSAYMVPVPSVASREITVETALVGSDGVELRSMRLAPEPPPPRG